MDPLDKILSDVGLVLPLTDKVYKICLCCSQECPFHHQYQVQHNVLHYHKPVPPSSTMTTASPVQC